MWFSAREKTDITREVAKMLEKGAIQAVAPTEGQIVSSIFLRPKKDGFNRPIFNMKWLNQWLVYKQFKMEGIQSTKSLIRPGDYLVKINLKDAYFCTPIAAEHQRLLCFEWKGVRYMFKRSKRHCYIGKAT